MNSAASIQRICLLGDYSAGDYRDAVLVVLAEEDQ